MKAIFRAVFYLRSNYVNKEGKTPVMLRIYLNNERLSIGSTGIAVQQSQWDREKERLKGRTTEALSTNLELDNIQSGLQTIFKKVEMTDEVSLERIKSEYLGKKEDVDTLMSLFNKHNSDVARQVGVSVEAATLQKYNVCKKHFSNFLRDKYGRSDIRLSELGYIVIHDFDIYLRTVVGQNPNTATRMMKTFKTITILGRKLGVLHHDPFLNIRFHMEPVNRGFLTSFSSPILSPRSHNFLTCSDVSMGFFSYLITVYKLEDLPGCAVLMRSVGGHIDCKVTTFF